MSLKLKIFGRFGAALDRYIVEQRDSAERTLYETGQLPLRDGDLYEYTIEYKVYEHHNYKTAVVHAASWEKALELLQGKEQRQVRYMRLESKGVKTTDAERVVKRRGGGR